VEPAVTVRLGHFYAVPPRRRAARQSISVDIPPAGSQSFVIAFTPSAPITSTDAALVVTSPNGGLVDSQVGLNTLLLTAPANAVSDIVALAATPTRDGMLTLPGPSGRGAFSVAPVNVGGAGT